MIGAVTLPALPSLVVGRVSHARLVPVHHSFTYRTYQWLIDVDDPPRLPAWLRPLAGFKTGDHLEGGDSGGGIRGDLASFLGRHDVELAATDRVLMLANARILGHVFNPLTVFWVLDTADRVRAVVFEVHNTYRERHAYLLDVDADGCADTEKAFYVSPFNDVSGHYRVRMQLDADLVTVAVGLDRHGQRILTATSRGVPQPASTRALLRVSARHLLMTQRITALIRLHGLLLWLRRLPIVRRPVHKKEVVS